MCARVHEEPQHLMLCAKALWTRWCSCASNDIVVEMRFHALVDHESPTGIAAWLLIAMLTQVQILVVACSGELNIFGLHR